MRMRPACSRTNMRPVPSLGTSIPTGAVRPLTSVERSSIGGVPGGLDLFDESPPQPNCMTRRPEPIRHRQRAKEDFVLRSTFGIATVYFRNSLLLRIVAL